MLTPLLTYEVNKAPDVDSLEVTCNPLHREGEKCRGQTPRMNSQFWICTGTKQLSPTSLVVGCFACLHKYLRQKLRRRWES